MNQSRQQHGLLGPATISRQSKNQIYKHIGAITKQAEATTTARATACQDIVNFISFAAMNYLYVCMYKVQPQLILNIDATQFNVENTQCQIKVCVLQQLPTIKNNKVLPKKPDNTQGMALFIKFFLLITAGGDMLEPVYLIADDNMHATDFDIYKVKGLGISTDPGSHAWVSFCCT